MLEESSPPRQNTDIIDTIIEVIEEILSEDYNTVDIHELDYNIKLMITDISSLTNPELKLEYQNKLSNYKSKLSEVRMAQLKSKRSQLGPEYKTREDNQLLIQKRSSDILKPAHSQLIDIISVAESTLSELRSQNERVKTINDNAVEVRANLDHSNKLVNKMNRWWRG
jgi:hypothetical protein